MEGPEFSGIKGSQVSQTGGYTSIIIGECSLRLNGGEKEGDAIKGDKSRTLF